MQADDAARMARQYALQHAMGVLGVGARFIDAASDQMDLALLRRLAEQYGRQTALSLEALLSSTGS